MKKSLLCILLVASSAHAASFDCAKASSKTENLICDTPSLSQADDRLYGDYLKAKKATGNSPEFKSLTKQNWKQRERCTTAACLSNWYAQSTQAYKQILSAKDNDECSNAGDNISLDGMLIRMTYAGAPNYESIENGDEPETYFVLKPDAPIDCATDSPQFGNNKLMQLSLKSDDYKKYQDLVGGRVTVTGTFIYAETGHHHTPLMIDTQLIKATSSKAPQQSQQENVPTPTNDIQQDEETPTDNGAIMPLNLRVARQVGAQVDQRYAAKMANCSESHELSKNGCAAYGAIGIAKAYQAAGYSFRASILDAAKDSGVAYSLTPMRDMIFPFIIAIRTEDGTDFMVQQGVIESSDVPYLRSAFTEK